MSDVLDLGMGHVLRFTSWNPDLDLNPQYAHLADQLPVEKWGAILDHPNPQTGESCSGALTFDGPIQAEICPDSPRWKVECWDPLTISPSVLCRYAIDPNIAGELPQTCPECGNHGFIREGRWVPA